MIEFNCFLSSGGEDAVARQMVSSAGSSLKTLSAACFVSISSIEARKRASTHPLQAHTNYYVYLKVAARLINQPRYMCEPVLEKSFDIWPKVPIHTRPTQCQS